MNHSLSSLIGDAGGARTLKYRLERAVLYQFVHGTKIPSANKQRRVISSCKTDIEINVIDALNAIFRTDADHLLRTAIYSFGHAKIIHA